MKRMIYAIDFGTTNSLLAAADPEKLHAPIPLDPGARDPSILRSILYFPTMKQVHYGQRAIQEFVKNDMQGRLLRSMKRFLPIRSFIGTYVEDRPVNLEDILGFFLAEMRKRANEHFGVDVDSAVFGRPARFASDATDDHYAQYRLERSAKNAGFKHIEFCPEPVAAAHEFRSQIDEPRTVLIADYGGGTSDYTVVRISKKKFNTTDVLAIGGVPLAGDSLDGSIMRHRVSKHFGADVIYKVPFGSNVLKMPTYLMDKICTPAEISLLRARDTQEFLRNVQQWSLGNDDRAKMDRLFHLIHDQLGFEVFESIERTKRQLSDEEVAPFEFKYPDCEISEKIRRKEFNEFAADRIDKILGSLDQTVKDAGLSFQDIDIVCATGGTAKVAAIQEGLLQRFGAQKVLQHNHFHSIVQGLTVRAQEML